MPEGWEGEVRGLDWGGYVYGSPALSKEEVHDDNPDIQSGLELIIQLGYA